VRNEDVMIDLETLGTRSDAVILSIGAVRFDVNSNSLDDNAFYASVSIDSNLAKGRVIQEDSLLWWMKQDEAAQAVFHEPKRLLEVALGELDDWITHGGAVKRVWSNGADFDIPMLAHAFASFGWVTPWNFWDARCVRTTKNLPGAKDVKVENQAKHNALSDAIAQARLMQAVYKKLNIGHPMIKAV
jgi:DNA polymerase III epsilon subunit-like protein